MIKTPYGLDVFVQIERDIDRDIATVYVHAPMYLNKKWVMSHSYTSSQFDDSEILRDSDFISVLIEHYGVTA